MILNMSYVSIIAKAGVWAKSVYGSIFEVAIGASKFVAADGSSSKSFMKI